MIWAAAERVDRRRCGLHQEALASSTSDFRALRRGVFVSVESIGFVDQGTTGAGSWGSSCTSTLNTRDVIKAMLDSRDAEVAGRRSTTLQRLSDKAPLEAWRNVLTGQTESPSEITKRTKNQMTRSNVR